MLNAIRLRKLRRTFSSACQVCPQVLKTRSNALDSAIPALPVHISNTYQYQESHLVKWGVPRGWAASFEIIKFKNCSLGTGRPSNYPQTKGSGRTRSAKISDNLGSKLRAIACNYVKLKEGSFFYGSLYAIFECL